MLHACASVHTAHPAGLCPPALQTPTVVCCLAPLAVLAMQEKLASADAKRQQRLQGVVARAARRHALVEARAAALKQGQRQLAEQLAAHLLQAEVSRNARLAQTAARAGQAVSARPAAFGVEIIWRLAPAL